MVHITLPEKKLQDHVKDYYRGERVSNALLFLLGGAAITWTLLLYLWRHGQLSSGIFYSITMLKILSPEMLFYLMKSCRT
jgi:hypothetical protein